MTLDIQSGSPQFPQVAASITASPHEAMDEAIQTLQAQKDAWVALPIRERITLLETLTKDFLAITERWVAACCRAKGLDLTSPWSSEEWGAGTWPVLKNLRQLRQSLLDIERDGHPNIPGPITTRANGQVVAQVFPQTAYDRLLFSGLKGEVWMQPDVTKEQLPSTQALAYRDKQHSGRVALVLGAGNVASIGPLDILYKLFVEDQVVLFKANPVNAYLGPLLAEGFRALVVPGYLRIVYGGPAEGSYLCNHPDIDEIHITGSDKTFDAIVFGPGPDGAARKAARQPILHKRITGELGNVSPVIIVPGPWSPSDLRYQAEHIVSMLTNNAGFNCNATRVIIQSANWPSRQLLLQQVQHVLAQIPLRAAYYPGAHERQRAFVAAHSDAQQIGTPTEQQLPWTLITGVDPQAEQEIAFTTEAFCGLFAETALPATDVIDYIERAVAFANEHLWGSLSATILVHPKSLRDPNIAAAVERAISELRYGAVGLNYWAGTAFVQTELTWGAFPGHDIYDIQSGSGVVHNTLMFARAQKSVLRAPFRSVPKPLWFATQVKAAGKTLPKMVRFETAPSPGQLPSLMWSALLG